MRVTFSENSKDGESKWYNVPNSIYFTLGKTIFCEKPVSESIEGVKKCFKRAKEVGKEIVCSFNRYVYQIFKADLFYQCQS